MRITCLTAYMSKGPEQSLGHGECSLCLLSLPQLPCLHVGGHVASLSLDSFCKLRVMAVVQVNW